MSPTFQQLGIPFPLFHAPADQASEYAGIDQCSLCQKSNQHCFTLGIGCDLILPCPKCHATSALDADDHQPTPCRKCKSPIPFPPLDDTDIKICYACLRAGKAAITHDTQLGMITWQQALDGITHGLPTPSPSAPVQDTWTATKLPQNTMLELIRTPTYITIQGEQWQFCCHHPMTFLGEWTRKDFSTHAPDDNGKTYFNKIVQDIIPGLWEDQLHDTTGIYVFQCPTCKRTTAHWDIA